MLAGRGQTLRSLTSVDLVNPSSLDSRWILLVVEHSWVR